MATTSVSATAGLISSSGLGSGLDISAIVTALVNAEKAPKQNQIDTQKSLNTTRLSAVSSLKSALDAFNTAMKKLSDTTTPQFQGLAATSSATGVLTATSSNTAVAGTYSVKVDQLATSSKVVTGGLASSATGGVLQISQSGKTYNVNIDAGATPTEMRDAINKQLKDSGSSVTANIINDSNGAHLVFGSTVTGEGSDISTALYDADGTTPSSDTSLNIDGSVASSNGSAGYLGSKAQDASLTIDGFKVTSSTNEIKSAVSGLTMSLVAKGESTVTVAANSTGLKTSLQSFVDAYNKIVTTINSLSSVSQDADGNNTLGALTGDSTARTLLSSMRGVLVQQTGTGSLNTLAQLGILTDQKTGALSIDSTKFDKAVANGLGSQIQDLFTGTDGVITRMTSAITPYVETGGILDSKTTQYNKLAKTLADQQSALDRRIETLETSLSKKYNAMDTLVAQIKATSSSILTTLNALNNSSSDS